MDYLKLTQNKLDIGEISELVAHESCGAVSLFVGITRDNFEDKKVISLEYEAYDSMAMKAMKNICEDVRSNWSAVKHIAIYHRLGVVPVKEASIVVALSSPHRVDSMLAVQYAMDKLKAMVPVWKKEIYADSENGSKVSMTKNLGGVIKSNPKRSKFTLPAIKFIASSVPSHLVQIKADSLEIGRRISSFITQKRGVLNELNIKEFIQEENKDREYSCARVDAVLWKRKDSKSHLKVYKVVNEYGPQLPKTEMKREEKQLPGNETCVPNSSSLPEAIAERVLNCETHLNVAGPVSKDIYARLKAIEDRILHLESVSPEYAHFWTSLTDVNASPVPKPTKQEVFQDNQKKLLKYPVPKPKPKFTSEDLNRKMEELKRHIEEHRLTNES